MAEINWEEINSKLPYQRNDEEKAKRRELFKQFDPNGNGYLSLAEVSSFNKKSFFFCKFHPPNTNPNNFLSGSRNFKI